MVGALGVHRPQTPSQIHEDKMIYILILGDLLL